MSGEKRMSSANEPRNHSLGVKQEALIALTARATQGEILEFENDLARARSVGIEDGLVFEMLFALADLGVTVSPGILDVVRRPR